MTRNTLAFATLGMTLLLGGCAGSTSAPRQQGSYTATRHLRTGSNIPQPENIDSANAMMPPDDLDRAGNNQSRMSMGGGGGGGGR